LGEVYSEQEGASDDVSAWDGDDVSDLQDTLTSFGERLTELADEYTESCENIREHFSESEKADECEEKAEGLNEWQQEVESASDNLEEYEPQFDDEVDCEGKKCEELAEHQGDGKYECQSKECGAKFDGEPNAEHKESWVDDQRQPAQEAVDNCPL
jgi:chromosome segregation ATPase